MSHKKTNIMKSNLIQKNCRIVFLLSVLILSAFSAHAQQTYEVTSGNDAGGQGTLRWAIEQVNAGSGNQFITFAGSVNTILLTGSLPEITKPVTITGNTDDTGNPIVVIDAENLTGINITILSFSAEASGSTIKNLIAQNAKAVGGQADSEVSSCGFHSAGDLTAENCRANYNTATCLYKNSANEVVAVGTGFWVEGKGKFIRCSAIHNSGVATADSPRTGETRYVSKGYGWGHGFSVDRGGEFVNCYAGDNYGEGNGLGYGAGYSDGQFFIGFGYGYGRGYGFNIGGDSNLINCSAYNNSGYGYGRSFNYGYGSGHGIAYGFYIWGNSEMINCSSNNNIGKGERELIIPPGEDLNDPSSGTAYGFYISSGTVLVVNATAACNTGESPYSGHLSGYGLYCDNASLDVYNSIFWGNTTNIVGIGSTSIRRDVCRNTSGAGILNIYNSIYNNNSGISITGNCTSTDPQLAVYNTAYYKPTNPAVYPVADKTIFPPLLQALIQRDLFGQERVFLADGKYVPGAIETANINNVVIVATAGQGGSITPASNVGVPIGTSQTFTFNPDAGYRVADVLIDGVSDSQAVSSQSYTFNDVNANHTIVVIFGIITSIKETGTGQSEILTIYPNPVVDRIYISGLTGNASLKIIGLNGNVLINNQQAEPKIDVSSLQSGMYFLQISLSGGEVITKKFIKN